MLAFLLAATVAFPRAVAPAQPVSPVTWTAPVYGQQNPVIASNGSMLLVVWSDQRLVDRIGFGRYAFATRVDAGATPLDPLGIVLRDITAPEAVIWTGEDFAVIGRSATGHAAVFISADGSVSQAKAIDVPPDYSFGAVSSSGADARVLYVHYNSSDVLNVRVVGARGDLLASVVTPLSAHFVGSGNSWIATGRTNDFAIVDPAATVHLDRDGHVLANASSPVYFFVPDGVSLAGIDGHGFILLTSSVNPSGAPTVVAYAMNNDAAFTGKTALVDVPWIWRLAQSRPAIVAEGDHYIVVNRGLFGDNTVHQYVAYLTAELVASVRETADGGLPQVLISDGHQRFLVAGSGYGGLYLQRIAESLEASAPVLLNISATTQTLPAVAAASNSFAVAWLETGPDAKTHTVIRRFAPNGEPLDGVPLEAARSTLNQFAPAPMLTATGDVYFVGGRRLNAATGQWIDDRALSGVIAATSNGRDILATIVTMQGRSLQRIPAFGSVVSNPVALPSGVNIPVIASDGADYLVVWSSSYSCPFECVPIPTPVYALRVRADGTWIGKPLQLSPNGQSPSVAWSNGTYVVTWGEGGIRATRVTRDGAVLDGSGDGVLIDGSGVTPILVPFGSDVILFVRHETWTAVRLRVDDLASAVAGDRTFLAANDGIAAASLFNRLLIAYDMQSDATLGFAPRVLTQQFADPVPRRRTIGH